MTFDIFKRLEREREKERERVVRSCHDPSTFIAKDAIISCAWIAVCAMRATHMMVFVGGVTPAINVETTSSSPTYLDRTYVSE
jgi:hypothetical protein